MACKALYIVSITLTDKCAYTASGMSCKHTSGQTLSSPTLRAQGCGMLMARSTWTLQQGLQSIPLVRSHALSNGVFQHAASNPEGEVHNMLFNS